jgi:hypothetical protein
MIEQSDSMIGRAGVSEKIKTGTKRQIATTAVIILVFNSKDHLSYVGET